MIRHSSPSVSLPVIFFIRPFEKCDVLGDRVVRAGGMQDGILIKFGTQKHQGKTKTKFEPSDLDLIFKVTEVI